MSQPLGPGEPGRAPPSTGIFRAASVFSRTLGVFAVLSGCGPQSTPGTFFRVLDAGSPLPPTDTDGDGLCDLTERHDGTDPTNADTDSDGLLDSVEIALGTDPNSALDPPPSDRLSLSEVPGSVTAFDQFIDYNGTVGEVVDGAIQDRGTSTDGRAALGVAGFSVAAMDADPAAYVSGINGAEFVGVLGFTSLHWRIVVQPTPTAGTLGCRRAYGYTFVVRQSGGAVADTHAMVLDETALSAPDGGVSGAMGPDGGGPWPRVSPAGLCLPAPPCR